jgi:hypothetical protein
MTWRRSLVAVGLTTVLAASACASASEGPGSGPSSSASATTAVPGASPSGLPTAEGTTTLDPSLSVGAVSLKGTVAEGVEAGCVVLNADNGAVYLLIGGDPQVVVPGARVEVQAVIQTDLVTTCQQGTPAAVQSARRI